jgi:hypothetical protein
MMRPRGIGRRGAIIAAALFLIGAIITILTGQARAAVPNRWGFAFVDKPTVAGVTDPNHQAGSWPAPFQVKSSPGVVGQVLVRFPKIAVKGGVVHVTAVNDAPAWCQAQKWGPSGTDEVVAVRCFRSGKPFFTPFVVLFTQSSKGPFPAGRAYGYVHFQPGSGNVASFNSAGGANVVTHLATGVWRVTLNGLGALPQAGNVQVTAVNATKPAKCQVAAWAAAKSRQVITVRCFNATTTPMETGWTLSYQRGRAITGRQPKLFAYTFDNKPAVAGPYMPAPAGVNFSSVPGPGNTVLRAGLGLRLVTFPRVGLLPNTVLVTPFKAGAGGFCNLITLWATTGAGGPGSVLVRDVACYTGTSARANLSSLITYSSKF